MDGKLIAAIEEERFTRVKHWAGFPERAIAFCLKEAGVGYDAVDHYAIGRDPKAKFFKKLIYLAKNPGGSFAAVKERFVNSKKEFVLLFHCHQNHYETILQAVVYWVSVLY